MEVAPSPSRRRRGVGGGCSSGGGVGVTVGGVIGAIAAAIVFGGAHLGAGGGLPHPVFQPGVHRHGGRQVWKREGNCYIEG